MLLRRLGFRCTVYLPYLTDLLHMHRGVGFFVVVVIYVIVFICGVLLLMEYISSSRLDLLDLLP